MQMYSNTHVIKSFIPQAEKSASSNHTINHTKYYNRKEDGVHAHQKSVTFIFLKLSFTADCWKQQSFLLVLFKLLCVIPL